MNMLSIIIPVYNAKKSIDTFCHQLAKTLNECNQHYECIFIENGSHDDTLMRLHSICSKDYHFHYIAMHHNISIMEAYYIGVQYAKGDYIQFMELQHPVYMIPEFYSLLTSRSLLCVGGLLQDSVHAAKKQHFFKLFDADVVRCYRDEGDYQGFVETLRNESDTVFWISYCNLEHRELSAMHRVLKFLNIRYQRRTIYGFFLFFIFMIVIIPCILILHFKLDINYSYMTCLLCIGCIFIILERLHNQFFELQAKHHMEQIKDSTFHY